MIWWGWFRPKGFTNTLWDIITVRKQNIKKKKGIGMRARVHRSLHTSHVNVYQCVFFDEKADIVKDRGQLEISAG